MRFCLLVSLILLVPRFATASFPPVFPDSSANLSILELFPDEGKTPGSEAIAADTLPGYGVHGPAYVARYGTREVLFIIRCDSLSQMRSECEAYLRGIGSVVKISTDGVYDVTDPVRGPVSLLIRGTLICGAIGERDLTVAHWRLSLVESRISEFARAPFRVSIPPLWRFATGDDPKYALRDFQDGAWAEIRAGAWWEPQGFDGYDGIGWYRTRLNIPSSTIRAHSVGESLVLCLGKMDDNDTVYVNGTRVGRTIGAGLVRKYYVPNEVVRWDTLNTIAVRVEDTGGAGGLGSGPYYVKAAAPSDMVRVLFPDEPAEVTAGPGQSVARNVTFLFRRPVRLTGTLSVRVENINSGMVAVDSVSRCTLGPGGDSTFSYSLSVPSGGSYRSRVTFVADSSRDTVKGMSIVVHAPLSRRNERLAAPVATARIADRAIPIPFENVVLGGYLGQRLQFNLEKRLLKIDESGLLAGYLQRPGNQAWVNEYAGKYLSAASHVWRFSKNTALKSQMDRVVDVLIACQLDDGYLGTYLPQDYWLSWDVWGHKYNLIGLLGYYRATGFTPALDASRRMGDLLCRTFGKGPGQRNIARSGEWHGMASGSVLDPMVDLYSLTGEERYLDFCRYVVEASDDSAGPRIISKLAAGIPVDKIAEGKAYEMLSNLLGLAKLYRVTGDIRLLEAAKSAWKLVTGGRLYVTGSTSSKELFQEADVLPGEVAASIAEGCVTTEWIHFNEELFRITGEVRFMEEIEKTVYNHLLAAENPLDGCVSYYTPLMGKRNFRADIDGNCCLASVPRGLAVIPELFCTTDATSGLCINLYSAGSAACTVTAGSGERVPLTCAIATRFPEDGKATITLDAGQPARFPLKLRVPAWTTGYRATVKGKTYRGRPGSYLTIDRLWDGKAVVEVDCGIGTRIIDGGKSYPGSVALKRGPQVLALDEGMNPGIAGAGSLRVLPASFQMRSVEVPSGMGWFGSQAYEVRGRFSGNTSVPVVLVPFAEAGQKGDAVRVWLGRQ